jgi:nitroreductase
MSTLVELIRQRRSAALFADDSEAPDRATLTQMIDLAIQAPNHRFTFPWRFHVVTGADRAALGDLWAEEAVMKGWVPEASRSHERAKLLRSPLVIFVGVVTDPEDAVRVVEDRAATSAAVAQLLLLLEDAGFAGAWRTGRMVVSEAIPKALSYQPGEVTEAILYIGQRRENYAPPPRLRPPVDRVVSWGLHPTPLTSPTAKDAVPRA